MYDGPGKTETTFSVIIPALNEVETIGGCIAGIRSIAPGAEIIVADGGSGDGTVAAAEEMGAIVVHAEPCRGHQCNRGAAIASGNILIFLHADTRLPAGALDRLTGILARGGVEAGNFRISFEPGHWFLRLLGFLARFDMGLFRFGDQGIVIRKTLFHALGGFPDWELFEDMALMRRARRRTGVHRFPIPVTTSARRFLRNGIIRQQLVNMYYTVQFLLGVPPWRLAEKYYRSGQVRASLVLFLRLPVPGEVKTRLAGTLGSGPAAQFYRDCAGRLLGEARKLPPDISPYIYYAPGRDEGEVRAWTGPCFRFRPQAGRDLGDRLKMAFREQFRSGVKRVVVAATDVPDLSAEDIEQAMAALDEADVVIGPSTDGGYYLIGMGRFYPALFEGIEWSTDRVYAQTMAAADRLKLAVHSLRCLDDIDTEEDLRRWQSRAPATARREP